MIKRGYVMYSTYERKYLSQVPTLTSSGFAKFVIVDFSLEICKYVFMNKRISDNPNLSEVHVLHDANNISSAKILRILQIKCGIYGEM